MAENTAYFEAISAERAMAVDAEDALKGGTLLSIETCGEFTSEESIYTYVLDHFDQFLKYSVPSTPGTGFGAFILLARDHPERLGRNLRPHPDGV